MNKRGFVGEIIFMILLVGLGAIIYSEYNMEYKYTAKVPCYDKYNSLIHNTTCSHDVYCGPWQESTPFNRDSLPCVEIKLLESGIIYFSQDNKYIHFEKDDALVSGDEQ